MSIRAISRWFLLVILMLGTSDISLANAFPGEKSARTKKKPHVVFLISEDSLNYEAHKTIPVFAQKLRETKQYEVTVLLGEGTNNAFRFPGMEILKKADLVVLFSRRIALPHVQMQLFKDYLKNGGPLVAIRTGNHAFTTRGDVVKDYASWPEFVPEILGCGNYGYGPVELGTDVSISPEASKHPILKNFNPGGYHSIGNLYRVMPLVDKKAVVLLNGKAGDEIQPVAWTRMAGKSRVFYTTLGYPSDFSENPFNTLIVNAIAWAISGRQE
ncbi:ThuA domain-containing protein [Dyadobacter sp. CY323]|uniref:ThuA domain-containing protein n=1 Tax=Dyadobacter sp. CY323 TaxID=2907302 RepID=UPI001F2A8EDC|nr:ThuA domain-containing protein [Dyadobacter sp. CY323]MCE6992490.1 ThuA domain-containing protein [Dyadobacter sp. CY323]